MKDMKKYDEARRIIGDNATDALIRLHSHFDSRVYEWAATTWDPGYGAFYATTLARETEGYYPNIESTRQALSLVSNSGMAENYGGSFARALPAEMGRRIVDFVKDKQDPDGYFYLPWWGKDVLPSRIARDLSWAQTILSAYGEKPNYPYATEQIAKGNKDNIPAYFSSASALREYLESLNFTSNSYVHGQQIASQTPVAVAAGLGDVVYDFLAEHQNPDNGLWESEVNVNSISGLLKLGTAYNVLGRPIPNYKRTLESAIAYASSDHVHRAATAPYNAVNGIGRIIDNLERVGEHEMRRAAIEEVRLHAEAIINATERRIGIFKREDGGFSYFNDHSAPVTERCPVAPGLCESDMNGTLLVLNSDTGIYEILGLSRIPIYGNDDLIRFIECLAAVEPAVKKYPHQ